MKRKLFFIAAILLASLTQAQEVRTPLKSTIDTIPVAQERVVKTPSADRLQPQPSTFGKQKEAQRTELASQDSLHLPFLNRFGQTRTFGFYPLWWGGWYDWQLHKGLNVNLGASVFAQFGKNAWHKGAGFQQDISLMYAQPLTDKLSLAVGGYFNNISWAHDSWRDAGINAVLGYKFDDHWEAYLYAQKSLVNKAMPLPLYDMSNIGDRLGAAVRYNFSPSFSIQVSVESRKRPDWMHPFGYPTNDDFNSFPQRDMR